MDSPVRQYQKQKDYRRHKLFRKINRRRKAERQQAIDAPMKELRRKLKRYKDGKDEKKVYLDQSIDGVNLWRDNQTGGYFYQEGNGPRIDLTPFNTLGSDDPTTWSFLDAEGKEYNPRRQYTGSKISQTTDAQRVANEVRDIQNTRTWRSDVADQLHNFGDALMWSTMAMNPEGEAVAINLGNKIPRIFGGLKAPIITQKNAKFLSDAEWDAAYFNAIKRGDRAEIQRLRDLHFESKSPGNIAVDTNGHPVKTYHTVNDKYDPTFNEFDSNIEGTHTNIYTTDDKYMSGTYTSKIIDDDELDYIIDITKRKYYPDVPFDKAKKEILESSKWLRSKPQPERRKELYTYLQNPVVIDSDGGFWNHIPLSQLPDDVYKNIKVDLSAGYLSNNYSTRSLERAINPDEYDIAMGSIPVDYDGFIVKRVKDYGGSKRYMFDFKPSTVYSIKDPAKLKLADAVTYDDAGNIIPLSKRDNFNIKDLRYGIIPAGGLTTIANQFNSGKDSGIHIKPQNRGKFTALKKRTGKSASWFKAHGTPAQKKMATFALNAKKWKHK